MAGLPIENLNPGMLVTFLPEIRYDYHCPQAPTMMALFNGSDGADRYRALAGHVFIIKAVCLPFVVVQSMAEPAAPPEPIDTRTVALMEVTEEYAAALNPKATEPGALQFAKQGGDGASCNWTLWKKMPSDIHADPALSQAIGSSIATVKNQRTRELTKLFQQAEPGQFVIEWFSTDFSTWNGGIVDSTDAARQAARDRGVRVYCYGPKPSPNEESYA